VLDPWQCGRGLPLVETLIAAEDRPFLDLARSATDAELLARLR